MKGSPDKDSSLGHVEWQKQVSGKKQ